MTDYAPSPFLERLRAVRELLPEYAIFAFHTAASLHGFGVVESPKIHVTVPAGSPVPQLRGVVTHQHVLPVPERAEVSGLPCVPAARCAIDLARTVGRVDALAILDAALRSGEDGLVDECPRHDGRRGIRQVRALLGLADARAGCRQESHLRLIMHDGRLPAPVPQHGILDEAGCVRYRIDLAYEEERVGIEYAPRVDRVRHNWLSRRGWRLRYFTAEDLDGGVDLVVPAVREALRRRAQTRYSRTSDTSVRGAQP